MLEILIVLWIVVFFKKVLFWLWLWQTKQYFLKRLIDQFRSKQGKRLLINPINISKLVFLIGLIFTEWAIFPLLLIYLLDALLFIKHIVRKNIKYPVINKNTIVLIIGGIGLEILLLLSLFVVPVSALVIFDVFSILLVSLLIIPFRIAKEYVENKTIKAAIKKRSSLNIKTVGITGSYGKTSTKEIVSAILGHKYKVFKTQDHQNTDPVVAKYILDELDESYDIFVAEIGAYFKGGIKSACRFVQPNIGILTGINQQHVSLFGSQEAIIKTKYELIQSLPDDGVAIFNGENENTLELYKKETKKKRLYGFSKNIKGTDTDLWSDNIEINKEMISFRLNSKTDSVNLTVNALGTHTLLNIMAAVCAAMEYDITLQDLKGMNISQALGGKNLKIGVNNIKFIDSSYSSNPDGVMYSLNYLKHWPGKKIIIMPSLIELGKETKEILYNIGKKIDEVCDFGIITNKEAFDEISRGTNKVKYLENFDSIVKELGELGDDDIVLIEGRINKKLKAKLLNQ
jgi:UDP-N-acetylmuramoyl-tripeptide--D-alanyl-D-alanine ligase